MWSIIKGIRSLTDITYDMNFAIIQLNTNE